MAPDTDREARDPEALPQWLQTALKGIIPTAVIVAVGTGLVSWSNLAVLANRVDRIEAFADRGDRFTAQDGRHLEARIDQLEKWRLDHSAFGYEYVGKQTAQFREIFERVNKLEKKVEEHH